ncbi:MAG: plasmid pRiA4b ORF-3 family protein [Methylococcaceae bacterium]
MSKISSIDTYQLKVTLIGSKPPIWRTILVPSNMALSVFHIALQISMGWTNSHLHQFIADGVFYDIKDDDFGMDMEIEDENKYQLHQLLKSEKEEIKYEYDFGDGWEHKILLEKILPFDKDTQVTSCIKGKRACPPEDCGGVWGYQELIDTINDDKHPEYESMMEWLDGNFDPEAFDIDEVNNMLLEYVR